MADQLAIEARNCLLGRMSCPDLALIRPFLKPVALKFRQRLQSPNRKIENAFFLERGLGSVVTVSNNGRYQAEIATVGREGMVGLAIVLGGDRSRHATLIHVAGEGQCIAAMTCDKFDYIVSHGVYSCSRDLALHSWPRDVPYFAAMVTSSC